MLSSSIGIITHLYDENDIEDYEHVVWYKSKDDPGSMNTSDWEMYVDRQSNTGILIR